jgi:hypothetical protein
LRDDGQHDEQIRQHGKRARAEQDAGVPSDAPVDLLNRHRAGEDHARCAKLKA